MCKARQYSDQMQCAPCGLAWDVNDPDPPECRDGMAPGMVVRVWDENGAEIEPTEADKEHGRRTMAALLDGLKK